MMRAKSRDARFTAGAVISLLFILIIQVKGYANNWLFKDGKWYYYYTYDDPVENEWITDGGNEYYIGSKGLMSTDKWVSDKSTGEKYYVGLDGIKKKNSYTASKDKFVGPDGTELESFDEWRKSAKKNLKKVISALNRKVTVSSEQTAYLSTLNASNAAFTLYDLNGDGYKDFIVINKESDAAQVLDIQLWNPEEEEFYALMELDFTSDETAVLRREENYGDAWLIISRDINDFDFQRLPREEYYFQDVEHYHFGYNEYGDVIYYINNDKADPEEWNSSLIYRRNSTGSGIFAVYHDLNESTVDEQVDMYPSEEEIALFSEKG
ncbi:hypothetical protein [Oribacterium sp. P6A1]|uniref:hypothetical protein n=1 Tax=Oribacterium sp. P6A1 TaxID=1410612 RepID=UPI000560CF92|nr:hypothetical protein [Oribacterium sp. P6A1]